MKNKETLQAVMDRRLSFLDELPSCRPALMQRIAQEEAPVMKKKYSVGLVFALILVSLSVIAVATGLILSPRVSAARLADRALEKNYGITDEMNSFFGREEEELPDGTVKVTYFGAGYLEAPLGIYTVTVKNGRAETSWSHEGEDTSGGYSAEAWGREQLQQMIADSREQKDKAEYLELAEKLYRRLHPAGGKEGPSETSSETFEEYYARREGGKNSAMNAKKLSEEEMIAIGREFILTSFGLTESEAGRLELFTTPGESGESNRWYETVNDRPCFLVEYLLDEESFTPEMADDPDYIRQNAYYKVYVNVETGVIEQYEFNSGLGGVG